MIRGTVTEVKNGSAEGMSVLTVETTTEEAKREGGEILFAVVGVTIDKPIQEGGGGIPGMISLKDADRLTEKAFNAGRIGRKGRPGFVAYEEWKQTQPVLNGK